MDINVFVTIGGHGTRLKCLSPKDKHLLYWNDKRIIDWITFVVPNVQIIGNKKTNSRTETLQEIRHLNNCLVIDCDIIPFGLNLDFNLNEDCVWCFNSSKLKWGSAIVENNKLISSSEKGNVSDIKLSGAYYMKNVQDTLNKMEEENSIASGLENANVIMESTFIRLGDVEDYFDSIKIKYDYSSGF